MIVPSSAVRSTRLRFLVVLSLGTVLAGCKGGDLLVPRPDPGGAGILGSYFVTSFAPYEALAAQLRDQTAKYYLQNAQWSFPGSPTYDSYPIASSRIEYAHAVGLTGKGQTVAIIDDGFLTSHEVFSGTTITRTGTPAVSDHGTGVASIIAGNSPYMIGVAPDANLHVADFNDLGTMAQATLRARTIGAVAQNNSWTFPTLAADQAGFNSAFSGTAGQAYLTALDAYAAQGVVVFAVSNDNTQTQSRIMEALPALRPSLEAGWLAVGNAVPAFTNSGVTSAQMVSSGCLQAAQWCLVADGAWESARASNNISYGFATGSSFAAPQVSGALALLAEAFPSLTPHQLRLRLLASADNRFFTPDGTVQLTSTFSHGYSDTYGHGFLDLRAALLPIGTTTLSMPGGAVVAPDQPLIVSGAAMGDAVVKSLSAVDVSVTDSLAADFTMPGNALVAAAAPAPMAGGILARSLRSGLAAARLANPSAVRAAFDAHPGQTLDLETADRSLRATVLLPNSVAGAGLSMTGTIGDGPTRIDLGLKVANDAGAVMGFGSDTRSALAALQLGVTQDLIGGGFVSLGGELGVADLGAPGYLTDVSSAAFDSVSFEIGQSGVLSTGDRLSLGVALPTAITRGSASVALPVAAVASLGAPQVQSIDLDLSPAERQRDISISYMTPLADGEELMLSLVHAENYGNRAGVTDTAAVLAYTFRF